MSIIVNILAISKGLKELSDKVKNILNSVHEVK